MAKKKRNLISSLAQNPKSWRKRKSSKLWSLLKKVSSAFFVFCVIETNPREQEVMRAKSRFNSLSCACFLRS